MIAPRPGIDFGRTCRWTLPMVVVLVSSCQENTHIIPRKGPPEGSPTHRNFLGGHSSAIAAARRELNSQPLRQAPCASRASQALCLHGSEEEKAKFLETEWKPFYDELAAALVHTQTNHIVGIALEQVLPPQTAWETWSERCRQLTLKWHGNANVSAVFQLLIECSEYDGISPYRFSDVPREWSTDGWVRALDGNVRAAFSAKAREMEASKVGVIQQSAGESAIDNTVLPNILTKREAQVLLAGKAIKEVLVRTIARSQTRILSNLVTMGAITTTAPLALKPAELSRVLSQVSTTTLVEADVREHTTAWQRLRAAGCIIQSFGDLSSERLRNIQVFLDEHFAQAKVVSNEAPELSDFVKFIRSSPGKLYQQDRLKHKEMLMKVV
uniref:Uncharacterized protein n=1 Tax=Haptolina ericina TaxID=156174 RepID=A0A6T9LQN7_9EUKA